jgi:hypothetical protein
VLVQQIMDREGCSQQEAEFIVAVELGWIDGDEFETDEHPAHERPPPVQADQAQGAGGPVRDGAAFRDGRRRDRGSRAPA